jgi:Bacterial Ig domain
MNKYEHPPLLIRSFRASLFISLASLLPHLNAETVWNGPNITWTKSGATPSDTVLAGKVVLTRGGNNVLFNTAAGEVGAGASSPADTEWAFGTLANHLTLTYHTMGSMRGAAAGFDFADLILNKAMVMHIKNEDIYVAVTFTTWGRFGAGTVAYTRSTAPASSPTVSISSPASGSTFSAPTSIHLTANASVSGGTVTNVAYFAGSTSLGHATVSPFAVTGSIPNAGSYSLTAVATASGLSATSSVVNITVVSPTPVSVTPPGLNNGQFSFSYNADPGLSYVVQGSSNLFDWVSLVTNVAAGSTVPFSAGFATNPSTYFRVGRLPNP